MPSPFCGMDPYLEGSLWMTVHTQMSAEIARQLAPKLRPKYLALTTERFVYDEPESVAVATSTLYPDGAVAESGRRELNGVSAIVATPTMRVETLMPVPVPHVTVEIRDTANRQLVTAIELLSPTNKRGDGRSEYLAKRRRILLSTAHLMEIDLLRQGQRVPIRQSLPDLPYFVFLSRAENRPLTDVFPIALTDPLPNVQVPLLSGDQDVSLDLQRALQNIYDLLGYDLAIDYSKPPEAPLPQGADAWADSLLRAAGLRP